MQGFFILAQPSQENATRGSRADLRFAVGEAWLREWRSRKRSAKKVDASSFEHEDEEGTDLGRESRRAGDPKHAIPSIRLEIEDKFVVGGSDDRTRFRDTVKRKEDSVNRMPTLHRKGLNAKTHSGSKTRPWVEDPESWNPSFETLRKWKRMRPRQRGSASRCEEN